MRSAVLGMGGWGTALANLLATGGRPVDFWGRSEERAAAVQKARRNELYLPNIPLAETVSPTADLGCVREADLLVFVAPSRGTRELAERVREIGIKPEAILISGTKGFEFPSGKRISQILEESFPSHQIAVLSGPNHAEEVGLGMPTASVLGGVEMQGLEFLQQTFSTGTFRAYTSTDILGIELGGALKNVYALAAGTSDGLGLGDNSKAALVTRCLAEMIRLGVSLGGKRETFYGLSGIGDLMVTCFSQHSRNRAVGERLGRGESLDQIRSGMRAVAEGVPTTETAFEISRNIGVVTPVLDQMHAVLFENKKPKEAIRELMSRELRSEHEDCARLRGKLRGRMEEPIIDLQSDQYFMGEALRQAVRAYEADEAPIGAVVVRGGRIIARAYNQVETLKDATAHAEMLAITMAESVVEDWRLNDCELYVTKEPCPMCAGALVHARLGRVIFGAPDAKGGAAGGMMNILQHPSLNHQCQITQGVRLEECRTLLQEFFREKRLKPKVRELPEIGG